MPPKRGRGQGGRGRGRGSPKAKAQAVECPTKPDLEPAETATVAEGCVEEPLSQELMHISGDVAEADGSQEAEVTTVSKELKVLDEMDTEANVPIDLEQAGDENKAASISAVGDSELDENRNTEQQDESVQSLAADPRESEEKMELSDVSLDKDVVVINDDDVIIIDDDQGKEIVDERLKEAKNSRSFWNLRVCPILFQGIVQNKDNFIKIMAKCLNFELRMSQLLLNKRKEHADGKKLDGAHWVPREPPFNQSQAATAGLLELKLTEEAVPEIIKLISSCEYPPNVRVRFELTKITKGEALKSPCIPQDNLKKEAENEEEKEGDSIDIMQVNFKKRFPLIPLHEVFLKHPEGHVKQEEDDYLFLSNVPDDLPDSILVAIMNTEMKERKLGENSTGTATFKVSENVVAEEYMARFDGILVNSNMVEMSTILGSLSDLKRLRSETRILQQEEAKKRKLEGKSRSGKKSRWNPQFESNQPPGMANKQGGRGRQQQGFASKGGRGQGKGRRQRPGFNPQQRGGGKVGQGTFFQKPQQQQRNRQPGNRNPQMAHPGNRNPQLAHPFNRSPQMAQLGNISPGNRNPQQMMAHPGNINPQQMMNRPGQSPSQSYQSPNNNRDVRRPMMRNDIRPQPLMAIGFGVKREPEPDVQIHTMANLQAQLLEKQQELNFLQNQARMQMAMIEQQEMVAMHHQREMQQFSPAGQPSYQNWQPNRPPNRQPNQQQYRARRRNRRR